MPPPTPRRNPSHALHPPVPVQTSPWLSSPLLRYVTCMPTTGRSQIRISMDTFSCEPDSSLMCSEQHDQHLTNRPLIYALWVPSTTWDWIAFLCWPGNPEGCYFADVGTSLECRNYLQSGLRPCFLHKRTSSSWAVCVSAAVQSKKTRSWSDISWYYVLPLGLSRINRPEVVSHLRARSVSYRFW